VSALASQRFKFQLVSVFACVVFVWLRFSVSDFNLLAVSALAFQLFKFQLVSVFVCVGLLVCLRFSVSDINLLACELIGLSAYQISISERIRLLVY
jgi:DMSO/TMAO reductase YedYZ heme-binding membrane subunit